MASRTELEQLESRKMRLKQENDLYRRDLAAEAGNLRAMADLVQHGYAAYKTAMQLRKWLSPFLALRKNEPKKKSFLAKLWNGGQMGFRLWRQYR